MPISTWHFSNGFLGTTSWPMIGAHWFLSLDWVFSSRIKKPTNSDQFLSSHTGPLVGEVLRFILALTPFESSFTVRSRCAAVILALSSAAFARTRGALLVFPKLMSRIYLLVAFPRGSIFVRERSKSLRGFCQNEGLLLPRAVSCPKLRFCARFKLVCGRARFGLAFASGVLLNLSPCRSVRNLKRL